MKTHVCLAAWLVAMAQATWADGATERFTGAYGGGQLGYLWLDHGAGQALPGKVAAGGVHLGYLADWSGALVGVEVELDTQSRVFGGGAQVVDALARLKLRAGRLARGIHSYGFAGLAVVDTSVGDAMGWSLGIGAEVPVSAHWRIGAELVQDRFLDIGGSGGDLSITSLTLRASYRF